ncbi:cytochrome c biogenesis heme-transporting ATPase CcmA [Noviherbaspirillum galbum]|uniref:Cytochrome c biogenesis heme-transporting ATPase CcmA n=1 Tax=Noviherbaspirillum galbum TaxID=2709383 RepID=A0A6B3SQI9_9BURK|nr:cytochrome c biogenesis heme-transporting ATPase CcmA [Noviherbaspirillum galbum]NEX61575.1 cytochrome c biogenesis heme-transporting ATPase CcmA [Noviherbaspirillum galbum]
MTLEASKLTCRRGDLELFAGIDAVVAAGDALRVAGGNGSGKTSLLRILAGLSPPEAGEVAWQGRNIRRIRDQFNSQLVFLGHALGVKDELLAWENLVMAMTLAGRRLGPDEAIDALEAAGIGHIADLPGRALSEGQRKRVALARLPLLFDRPLWILDEPFAALDVAAIKDLIAVIDRHLAGGGMLVYTTHQDVFLQAARQGLLDLGKTPERPDAC